MIVGRIGSGRNISYIPGWTSTIFAIDYSQWLVSHDWKSLRSAAYAHTCATAYSCNSSLTWKVTFTLTFHRTTLLASTIASMARTCAVWMPLIVTPAREIANCTASSTELAEMPVRSIVFSTMTLGRSWGGNPRALV